MAQLENAVSDFEFEAKYHETEVNDKLRKYFEDHVFARRLLIEWGFLDRTPDGTAYWRLK
jgi:hypothetical protein